MAAQRIILCSERLEAIGKWGHIFRARRVSCWHMPIAVRDWHAVLRQTSDSQRVRRGIEADAFEIVENCFRNT